MLASSLHLRLTESQHQKMSLLTNCAGILGFLTLDKLPGLSQAAITEYQRLHDLEKKTLFSYSSRG
jgi:hypothetical protein